MAAAASAIHLMVPISRCESLAVPAFCGSGPKGCRVLVADVYGTSLTTNGLPPDAAVTAPFPKSNEPLTTPAT